VAEKTNVEEKKMPRGGRKGGTVFPRLELAKALQYTKKLVAKTHTSPQPARNILPGVFGSSGGRGKIRASALKQYDLLGGPVDAYKATELAKAIDAAPEAEQGPLIRRAFLKPKVFSDLYKTFHGDTVSRARLEQRTKALEVHPDSAEECVRLFIDSALTAGIGTLDGDALTLIPSASISEDTSACHENVFDDAEEDSEIPSDGDGTLDGDEPAPPASNGSPAAGEPQRRSEREAKPGVALALQVDPSSDPDKLEKQLRLLRKYGLI